MFHFLGDSKSRRASKSHYWFKSYSDFAELVNLAHWWSFSGKGSASAAWAAGLFFMTKYAVVLAIMDMASAKSDVNGPMKILFFWQL